MRILMTVAHPFPAFPEPRLDKEARTLLRDRHEIYVVCPNGGNELSEDTVDGVRIIRVTLPSGLYDRAVTIAWLRVLAIHPLWKRSLSRVIQQEAIEALHVHDLPLLKTALGVARECGIPIVADLHENYPEAVRAHGWSRRQRLLKGGVSYWKRVEKTCVRQADCVLTVIDETKDHYVKDCGIAPEKVIVLMNTEDPDYFRSLPVDKRVVERYQPYFTLTYVGRLGPHRGIQTAVSAMPAILREVPNARLLVVGSGSTEGDLRDMAREMGVAEAVEFTGQQPFSAVPSYIAASRVCLVPYVSSSHTEDSCPHKLFQYMAMGKPVVVSSMRSLTRIVRETGAGLTYSAGNADALAQAVTRLYRDKDLLDSMGEAGRKATRERFNWEIEGKKLVDLYEQLGQ